MTTNQSHQSPPWNRTTKVIIALVVLLLVALLARRFHALIGQIIGAAILAYILNPIIIALDRRTKLSRGPILAIVYLLFAVGVIGGLIALGVAAFQQISSFIELVPDLIETIVSFFQDLTSRTDPINILTYKIDPAIIPWDTITNQVLGFIEPILSQSGQIISRLAATTVGWLTTGFFVFMISIYVAYEIPKLGSYVSRFAQQPGYQYDAERLMREFGRIWSAYLRGQVVLGFVIFLVVWLGLTALGVQNALALGILAGLLEFIPTLGPIISAGVAIGVAVVQPTNYLGLTGFQYALVVLALMFLIQQLENTILVPRIVGESLDLNPLIVIVGVYMGGSLAGILGAVLAAPVVATIKLLGAYAWRKMFDLPPFPDPEEERPSSLSLRERGQKLFNRTKNLVKAGRNNTRKSKDTQREEKTVTK